MSVMGMALMLKWQDDQQRVVVCSQSGEKQQGMIIDYDDTEIVLEKDRGIGYPKERIICRNWFSVKEAPPDSCHD